ncbi:MAG: LytTR family DNA-binding domain-containing protein [Bacteroidota bacterium]
MKVFIVEDEEHSKKTLINFLSKYVDNIQIVGSSALVSEAIELINQNKPDLIFLDIDLPDGNGFEVLDSLTAPLPKVIFVTAYNQYAVKAFQVSAIDYLLKPIDPLLLKKAVEKAIDTPQSDDSKNKIETFAINNSTAGIKKLALPTQNGIQLIKVEDIIRVQADGNYSNIFIKNQKPVLVSKSLKVIGDWLDGLRFFRIHHSHIVNLDYIVQYIKGEGGSVILEDGTELEVSRRKKDSFLEMIGR